MKNLLIIPFILLLLQSAYSQELIIDKEELEDSVWNVIKMNNSLRIYTLEHFKITNHISSESIANIRAIKDSSLIPKPDTLLIEFIFEKGWTKERLNVIKNKNKKILTPLIEKYIIENDKTEWKIKSNKELFLKTPVFYLKQWPKLTIQERTLLKSIKRIPNHINENTGIFVNIINTCMQSINQKEYLINSTSELKELQVLNFPEDKRESFPLHNRSIKNKNQLEKVYIKKLKETLIILGIDIDICTNQILY